MADAAAAVQSDTVEKVSDMATGSVGAAAASEPAVKTEAPANDVEKPAEGEAAAVDDKPVTEVQPDKLKRAREVAKAKHARFVEQSQLRAEYQRRSYEAQQATYIAQQERAERERLQAQLVELRDPMAALSYLEKTGLPAKVLIDRAREAESPEAKQKAELQALVDERVSGLKSEYERQLAQINAERDQQRQNAQLQAARNQFISEASTDAYPVVSQLIAVGGDEWKASLVSEATRVLTQAFEQTGRHYTNEEVLTYLNQKYSKLISLKEKSSGNTSETPSKEATNGTGADAKNSAGTPRTLTNKSAQVKGSLPANFDDLSDREQKSILAALYRQQSRG